jgi:hypothetical protein
MHAISIMLPIENSSSYTSASLPEQSVVERLPVELLSRIFHYSVLSNTSHMAAGEQDDVWDGNYYNSIPDFVYENSAAPFVLASVCQRWRRVALADVLLWTTLVITSFNIDRETKQPATGFLERLIARSQDVPLDIFVDAQRCVVSYKLYDDQ